jgi:uncharacterized protein DUF6089
MVAAKKLSITFLMMLMFGASFSQGKSGYFAGAGVIFYNGDLNERTTKIISPGKVFKPFITAGLNYRLGKRTELSLGFLYGTIGGADSLASEKDNRTRNLSFKSVIEELSLQFEYHLFNVYRQRRLNPYVFAGGGVFHFNPITELNGVKYALQPVGTEGQYTGNDKYSKPYKLTQFSIPVGIGLYFQLNPHWRLKIYYANHFTFTDYLDDVSTIYPDSFLLANAPNGQLAVSLSNRRLKSGYPNEKASRGNPSLNDSFANIGITIIYNPGELKGARSFGSGRFKHKNKGRFNKNTLCPAYD